MGLTPEQQTRLETLKMLVSLRVDEYTPDEEDIDIPFGDIEYELNQAARYVMRQVPRNISFFGSRSYDLAVILEISGKNGGVIPLPSDYLRFISVKMQDWTLPVNEYMRDTSKAYKQQQFEMRRGTNEKPVAFLVPFNDEYDAGQAQEILAVKTDKTALPAPGDTLEDTGGTDVATVLTTNDPDYVYIEELSGYTASVGDRLVYPESTSGAGDGYDLDVSYLQGSAYKRTSKAKQGLEVYPYGSGQIASLDYVPFLKSYELPEEFEDMVVWRATSSILTIMRRMNDAEAALQQMAIAQRAINTGMYGEERFNDEQ